MNADEDIRWMKRAIELARNGRGAVEPNPMVGCVIIDRSSNRAVGEGFHAKFGEAHAEPAALKQCASDGSNPAGSTIYVTLEPCCHVNKKRRRASHD